MKHLVALLAMFLAMPMFADGSSTEDDPTNKKIQDTILNSIAELSTSLDSKVASLQTALGTAQSSITTLQTALATAQSAITTLQGAATRNEVAIVVTVPDDRRCRGSATGRRNCDVRTFLMGSTIPGFPRGTVNRTTLEFTDSLLPGGTYLIELQQPHSDNPLCHGPASMSLQVNRQATMRFIRQCAHFRIFGNLERLDGGSHVYTIGSDGKYLSPDHRFPGAVPFTAEAPASSYTGTIKITRLKP